MNKIYICACASRSFIRKADVVRVATAFAANGYDVELVADLCEMSADKDARGAELQGCTVVACHERAVRSLLDRLDVQAAQVWNLRELGGDALCQQALGSQGQVALTQDWVNGPCPCDPETISRIQAEMQRALDAMPVKNGTDAWNPTLDKQRCIECKKCLEFCPFGVYELVDGKVTVVNPHNCKNNCPACARHCPTKAVIFPKYAESPINGGLEDDDKAIQLDTKELYSATLRERLKARRESVSLLKKD